MEKYNKNYYKFVCLKNGKQSNFFNFLLFMTIADVIMLPTA